MAHQTAPDQAGPAVNMVNPRDGSLAQAATSRVGLTFSDQIDIRSLHAGTFIVRPMGGGALPGRYSTSNQIANFAPDQPLQPGIVYEVVLPAGGIRDFAGNPIAKDYVSRFSTGRAPIAVLDPAGQGFGAPRLLRDASGRLRVSLPGNAQVPFLLDLMDARGRRAAGVGGTGGIPGGADRPGALYRLRIPASGIQAAGRVPGLPGRESR